VHTDRSDGSVAPRELLRQAAALGIEVIAITDHDTLAGYDEACNEAVTSGVELICAVELSTRPNWQTSGGARESSVHLLGYFISSPPTAEFRNWLEHQQASRRQRNIDLIEKLHGLGVDITLQDAEVYGRNQVGRPHFARVLCEKGYVSSRQEAFDVYLADNAQAAVEREEPSLEEGIKRIRSGGGFAALAHPVRLMRPDRNLRLLITELIGFGLEGIEVHHSEHTPADAALFLDLARSFDLIQTGGSDFHGENKPAVCLGTGIDRNVCLGYDLLEQIRAMCHVNNPIARP
jgi:predicted metal-dependent phosphoesterase TrpH